MISVLLSRLVLWLSQRHLLNIKGKDNWLTRKRIIASSTPDGSLKDIFRSALPSIID
ncbi:hypothetical protein NPIL_149491, partial [Nephila pilipes]